jgi:hypothetical protein
MFFSFFGKKKKICFKERREGIHSSNSFHFIIKRETMLVNFDATRNAKKRNLCYNNNNNNNKKLIKIQMILTFCVCECEDLRAICSSIRCSHL